MVIVNQTSAKLDTFSNLGLTVDHFSLNKFANRDDENYKAVVREVKTLYRKATATARTRGELYTEHTPRLVVVEHSCFPCHPTASSRVTKWRPLSLVLVEHSCFPCHLTASSRITKEHLLNLY